MTAFALSPGIFSQLIGVVSVYVGLPYIRHKQTIFVYIGSRPNHRLILPGGGQALNYVTINRWLLLIEGPC